MSKSELEKKIEEALTKALEENLTEDEIQLLERKVTIIRSLAKG
jgi:hypothetical protein